MSAVEILAKTAILEKKDPRAALTAEGMTSSGEEPIMYFSTPKSVDYHSYLKSVDWKRKKMEWVNSGRPTMCWACEEPMPADRSGFNFHHRTYANLGNENLDDLVLLCADDHRDLENTFKTNIKATGVSLESWTWIYISMLRLSKNLPAIRNSNISRFMGDFNE